MPTPPGTRSWWNEDVAYCLHGEDIARLSGAAAELHLRCLDAVDHVVNEGCYEQLGISDEMGDLVERSWREPGGRHHTLYGRMDLAYDGVSPPKLLEYNAESPTGALEAEVGTRAWLANRHCHDLPFGNLRTALAQRWETLVEHFDTMSEAVFSWDTTNPIDHAAGAFMSSSAELAGLTTSLVDLADIASWVDHRPSPDRPLLFKLMRWDCMLSEGVLDDPVPLWTRTRVLEPPWKSVLQSKLVLPLLWELFPNHPNLLPASVNPSDLPAGMIVRKPVLGMAQMNIAVIDEGNIIAESEGHFDNDLVVYQRYSPPAECDGFHPVFGCWIVGDTPAGLGVLEFEGILGEHRWRPHIVTGSIPAESALN